jgi:hypothetical protein
MLVESLESRVHFSLPGDANGDHRVDSLDFAINVLAGNFGRFEAMPLTENDYLATSGNAENDGDYSLGHVPTALEKAVFDVVLGGDIDTGFSSPHTFGQLAVDGGGDTFYAGRFDLISTGDLALNNFGAGITNNFAAVSGSVTGEGNSGEFVIASLTGVGKDLDVVATGVVVTSFAANADYTIGGSTPESGNLTINGGATTSIVRFTGGSQGGSEGASINNWHGTIVSNKVGATACAVNLGSSTLPADATLVSQLDGVTVTDGTGGTFSRFTKLRASGLDNTESTVTDGVEKSHARGSTYHGTYNPAWGFLPNQVTIGNYSGNPIAISASGGNWSLTLPDDLDLGSNQAVTLSVDGDTALLIDTITVTAAASGPGSVFGRTVVPAGMESIVLPQAIRDADSDLIESL